MATDLQRCVLDFIKDYTAEEGYAPTVRDVMQAMEWSSPSTAHEILERLKRRGLVTWKPGSPRTLRVLEGGPS